MDLSENPAELTREDLEKLTWIAVNGPEEKPNPPEKGLLKSSTFWFGAALALFAIADSTQPIWFPWVSDYVPESLGYLSGDTAVNVSLKLAGHILPVLVFLGGIIRGRQKAGGIRGLL